MPVVFILRRHIRRWPVAHCVETFAHGKCIDEGNGLNSRNALRPRNNLLPRCSNPPALLAKAPCEPPARSGRSFRDRATTDVEVSGPAIPQKPAAPPLTQVLLQQNCCANAASCPQRSARPRAAPAPIRAQEPAAPAPTQTTGRSTKKRPAQTATRANQVVLLLPAAKLPARRPQTAENQVRQDRRRAHHRKDPAPRSR
jgi:hypothetical protein